MQTADSPHVCWRLCLQLSSPASISLVFMQLAKAVSFLAVSKASGDSLLFFLLVLSSSRVQAHGTMHQQGKERNRGDTRGAIVT